MTSQAEVRRLVEEHTRSFARLAPTWQRPRFQELMDLLTAASTWRAAVLSGPRRTGKSTLLHQALNELPKVVPEARVHYYDFTDGRLREVGLRGIVEAFAIPPEERARAFFFFDEVHHVDDWADELTLLVNLRAARLAVADSSAAVLSAAQRELGVGRWSPVPVEPLTFGEWLDLRSATAGLPAPDADPLALQELARAYVRLGGFPEYALREADLAAVHASVEQDIVAPAIRLDAAPLHGIRQPKPVEALLRHLLRNSGRELSMKLASAAAVASVPAVRRWQAPLLETGLLWELPCHVVSEGKVLRTPPKLYAVDPMLVGVYGTGADSGGGGGTWAAAVETAVAQALRLYARRTRAGLWFVKKRRGKNVEWEVDFLLEEGEQRVALEVTTGPAKKKRKPLAARAAELGASRAIVVADTIIAVEQEGPVEQVPLHDLLLTLGGHPAGRMDWP